VRFKESVFSQQVRASVIPKLDECSWFLRFLSTGRGGQRKPKTKMEFIALSHIKDNPKKLEQALRLNKPVEESLVDWTKDGNTIASTAWDKLGKKPALKYLAEFCRPNETDTLIKRDLIKILVVSKMPVPETVPEVVDEEWQWTYVDGAEERAGGAGDADAKASKKESKKAAKRKKKIAELEIQEREKMAEERGETSSGTSTSEASSIDQDEVDKQVAEIRERLMKERQSEKDARRTKKNKDKKKKKGKKRKGKEKK
jgi:hypothetical protein